MPRSAEIQLRFFKTPLLQHGKFPNGNLTKIFSICIYIGLLDWKLDRVIRLLRVINVIRVIRVIRVIIYIYIYILDWKFD